MIFNEGFSADSKQTDNHQKRERHRRSLFLESLPDQNQNLTPYWMRRGGMNPCGMPKLVLLTLGL